jgi:exopolyphosphatase / guanosine-5'-triphosphate,3'-diphosphate pyrophosphatase
LVLSDAVPSRPALGADVQAAPTPSRPARHTGATYAALDLGTNNCRLLVARPTADGFRVVDAFSRIVRLGEGLSLTGRLSEPAIERTLVALGICRDKMNARGVTRARTIATEACRSAVNGAEFVASVRERLGVTLEIVDRETEAHLAAAGVGDLADREAKSIVMFDIGGGSSEIIWLGGDGLGRRRVRAWESMRLGVVTLAEKFGGVDVTDRTFADMTAYVSEALEPFVDRVAGEARCDRFHLLGTSGTVTTIAGVHLNLPRYDRRAVDGLWLDRRDVDAAVGRLRSMSYAERAANACIGEERADLVLAGCAILQAIRERFPAERLRIADRGLREGILSQLMREDRVGPHRRGFWR